MRSQHEKRKATYGRHNFKEYIMDPVTGEKIDVTSPPGKQDIDVEFSENWKELKKAWAELIRAIKKGAIR